MPQSPWKPPLPVTSPEQARTWQSLSQWLKVPWSRTWTVSGLTGNLNTGTPTAIPGSPTAIQFQKLRSDTRLIIRHSQSAYASAGGNTVQYWVRINSINTPTGFYYFNAATDQRYVVGFAQIDDVPEGLWSANLYASTSGQINWDANCGCYVEITETQQNPDF